MTVKELIEQLQQLPQDLHVFTNGYEGGLCDAEIETEVHDIALKYHTYWYYGPHELKYMVSDDNYTVVKGLIFKRTDAGTTTNEDKPFDPYLQTK